MKKCILMFVCFVVVLVIAVLTDVKNQDTIEGKLIVGELDVKTGLKTTSK